MKNKGFTLVELLSSLILLALLALITLTTVSSQYKRSKSNLLNKQRKMIKLSASMYVTDNKDKFKDINDCVSLSINYLVNAGYLDEEIKSVKNNSPLKNSNMYVNVKKKANTFEYTVDDDTLNKCEEFSFNEDGEI